MNQQPFSSMLSAVKDVPIAALIRQNIVWLGIAIIAIMSAPGSHGGWTIFWLIVASMLASAGLTEIQLARSLEEPQAVLLPLAIAGSSMLAAVIISLIVRPISGLFLILVLAIMAFFVKDRPFVMAALTVVLVPWWIWLALGQWYWQLLMLLPLIGLGLIAVSQLLDMHVWPESEERIMPERAHRAAAWMLIALSGIMLIGVGMLTDVSRPVLALAGVVLAVAIPLEAGFGSIGGTSARQSIRVVVSAYLIATACWLIGIA